MITNDPALEAYLDSRQYYAVGDIETFLQACTGYQFLQGEEESEMIKLAKGGNRDALEKLIASNLRFCVSVANQYKGQGLDIMELTRIAERSVAGAVMTFNPEKGERFIAHAVADIRADILSEIRH